MAEKKRKKGKKGIQYYGKATDGYDPYKSDGDWATSDGSGSEGTSGGSMLIGGKPQAYAKGSPSTRTGKSKDKPKPSSPSSSRPVRKP